ncbi:hypothetical protein Tco_1314300 [Tanacetum coccineum]
MFYQNRPFLPSYYNQNAFYQSPTGLHRSTMDSSTSSQANQPYFSLNCVTLYMDFEQLINNQEYYQSRDYSIGQGSAHGSAPVDEDDDSPVEEMPPVKTKKPLKPYQVAKISPRNLKPPRVQHHGGFNLNNEAYESEEETQEQLPMGHDRAKAKKKSFASSRGGSSSFVDLVADKFLNIKKEKWGKMKEQQESYIQLKNQELDIREAKRREAAELKREKLAIQRRTLELAEREKRDKDILFYNSEISSSLPAIQQQKLQEMKDEIKERYNLDY